MQPSAWGSDRFARSAKERARRFDNCKWQGGARQAKDLAIAGCMSQAMDEPQILAGYDLGVR
jgi:hypothetical protein